MFEGQTPTACGRAAATGPFYARPTARSTWTSGSSGAARPLRRSGDFAQAYVIAHEYGHHVQNLLGISEEALAYAAASSGRRTTRQARAPGRLPGRSLGTPRQSGAPNAGTRRLGRGLERGGGNRRRRDPGDDHRTDRPRELDPRVVRATCEVVRHRVPVSGIRPAATRSRPIRCDGRTPTHAIGSVGSPSQTLIDAGLEPSPEKSPCPICEAVTTIALIADHARPPPRLTRRAPASTISAIESSGRASTLTGFDTASQTARISAHRRETGRVEHVGARRLVGAEPRDRVSRGRGCRGCGSRPWPVRVNGNSEGARCRARPRPRAARPRASRS